MTTNSDCFQGSLSTHLLLHLSQIKKRTKIYIHNPIWRQNGKTSVLFCCSVKSVIDHYCSYVQIHSSHLFPLHRKWHGRILWIWRSMADGNLTIHCKPLGLCGWNHIDILWDFFPLQTNIHDMHAVCIYRTWDTRMHMHPPTTLPQSSWQPFIIFTNPKSRYFLTSRSQIDVFISIPIDSIVFSLPLTVFPPVSVARTNWNW